MSNQQSRAAAIKAWKLIETNNGPELPLFRVEIKKMENPRNGAQIDAVVLHARDTVNVVALDKDGSLILVQQYRFGIDQVITELPAGIIDEGEMPLNAAKRELQEETGHVSASWKYLGKSYLNPAYVTNCCHHYLATDCQLISQTHLDELEDLAVVYIPQGEIKVSLAAGLICDSVGKNAIQLVFK